MFDHYQGLLFDFSILVLISWLWHLWIVSKTLYRYVVFKNKMVINLATQKIKIYSVKKAILRPFHW